MKTIDFRSDTVTKPTQRMRETMYRAEVGDDVYGDDVSANELQKYIAKLTGKESSIFVPSGTFANQLALFTHCNRGDEVILPDDCHIVQHETGASSIIAGVQLRTIASVHGKMPLEDVENAIRKDEDIHCPNTGLICIENAFSDGCVIDIEYMKSLRELADKYSLKIHLDGARVFNAATALNVDIKDIANLVDSMNICLSKGLCAPMGSVLVGTSDFINGAIRKRKIMGGGMRQIGIVASAGLIAVKEMSLRLKEDHDNAKYLAEKLSLIPGIEVFKDQLDINMVFFKITDPKLETFFTKEIFAREQILINSSENGFMRFVTHYYITKEDIDRAVNFIEGLTEQI